jgi:hypothetical protein
MEAVQGELQSGLVSELGSRFGAATLNEMKQGQRPITDLAADTAAAVRAFAAGEATGSVMMAPVNVLFRVCAHTAMRANVGTLTGDALEQSLKNDMEKINEKLDHLMSAEHEARKFEFRALVNRIPIIMKKLVQGDASAEEDLGHLEDAADKCYTASFDAYAKLPKSAVEDRIPPYGSCVSSYRPYVSVC